MYTQEVIKEKIPLISAIVGKDLKISAVGKISIHIDDLEQIEDRLSAPTIKEVDNTQSPFFELTEALGMTLTHTGATIPVKEVDNIKTIIEEKHKTAENWIESYFKLEGFRAVKGEITFNFTQLRKLQNSFEAFKYQSN